MTRSLQWRLIWIFISITLSVTFVIWFVLNKSVESSYYKIFENNINNRFDIWEVGDNPGRDDIKANLGDNKNAVLTFLANENLSITVIDKKNNDIVFSSDLKYSSDAKNAGENEKFLYEILKSQNLISVLQGSERGDKDKQARSDSDGRMFFDYARKAGGTNGEFILYFRYYKDEWGGIISKFNNIILWSCLFAIVASLILGYALSTTITVPIVSVMHKAQKLAAGDFEQPLQVKSYDEIGALTSSFNYMASELKNTLGEISREKNKIETILNYMTDGVIAFNRNGEVIHINPAAKKMLEIDDFNKSFNEFSQEFNLDITLEEILYLDSSNTERNVDIFGRTVRVYFVLFTDETRKAEGVIAVLQDITEQQRLENMRRGFVANVSHELRTPLTSIKSYTETLLDGVLEDRDTAERFLGVINSETDRMTRLVKDLLELSRFDSQQMQWNMRPMSFVNLVLGAIEKVQIEAKNKDLLLESYVIGEIPEITADHDRIEQVALNLLSNAIKYTPSGGKITVYIGKMFNDVYMKVTDTGIGIPQEDLPRIFERFYRVDKARSREMGGTGLGLAIAKEIVEAHGGTISAGSELGKGTEITVRLPVV